MTTLWLTLALAAPIRVPLQGYLTDSDGQGASGTRTLAVQLFADADATLPLRTDTVPVALVGGAFALELGANGDLDATFFAQHTSLWVSIGESGGAMSARQPVGVAPFAAHAEHATTADRLGSLAPSDVVTFADGYTAGTGLTLTGRSFGFTGGKVDWALLQNVPPLGNTYTAGTGLTLTGNSFGFTGGKVDWSLLQNVPSLGNTYTAGTGLTLTGSSFGFTGGKVDWSLLQNVPTNLARTDATPASFTGGVRVGSLSACTGAESGALRFQAGVFEGCNGTSWTRLGGTTAHLAATSYSTSLGYTATTWTGVHTVAPFTVRFSNAITLSNSTMTFPQAGVYFVSFNTNNWGNNVYLGFRLRKTNGTPSTLVQRTSFQGVQGPNASDEAQGTFTALITVAANDTVDLQYAVKVNTATSGWGASNPLDGDDMGTASLDVFRIQ